MKTRWMMLRIATGLSSDARIEGPARRYARCFSANTHAAIVLRETFYLRVRFCGLPRSGINESAKSAATHGASALRSSKHR
jgi:hypothetical protein